MDRVEPGLVLGTAGHIDHGKTALIRALTGVETDRLPEEKARGITIDLGFAPLDLDGTRLSVVDVPGHEGLVRTMVAGATGIDLVLLVIAADEGVMPQTREHVAICDLLGITRGVVALTKSDIAEEDVAELAEEEVGELLASSELSGARIVRVSSTTGDGIEELRKEIAVLAETAPARTPRSGPPRLSIDRAFAAKGFGSVVTGTLVGSEFGVGDSVEVFPSGAKGRVRGIQNHGIDTERGAPGMRCAINLQGVDVADLARGQVISHPDALLPTRTLDVKVWWLAAAPAVDGPTSIEFLAGTAERRARLGLIAPVGEDQLLPGDVGFARLHIDGEPVPLVPGDRFIARGFARTEMGGTTLGGGIVLDIQPPHRRRSDAELLQDLEELAKREPALELRTRLRRSGLAGVEADTLVRETGLDSSLVDATLAELATNGVAAQTKSRRWLASEGVDDLANRLLSTLVAYHGREPLRPGMPTAALRGSLPDNVPRDAAELAIARIGTESGVVIEGDIARTAEHAPTLDAAAEELVSKLRDDAAEAALEPPSLREWAERYGSDESRFLDLLAHLERQGEIVRSPGDLWFDRASIDALRDRVIAHLREHGELTTPDYKALIGTSRRTAVPLMELFDTEHLTVRRGEARVLRSSSTG